MYYDHLSPPSRTVVFERLHEKKVYTRYGLLYMGYQPGREWWELVVAMRKVAVVAVGTFGTLLGVVDLQAFIALAIVFVSVLLALCFIGPALRSISYNNATSMLSLSDCHPGAFGGPAF